MAKSPNDDPIDVLWLLPAEPARSFLEATIARLARVCAAPLFAPHLTLGIGGVDRLEAVTTGPLELPRREIDHSSQFTKTLFVRCGLTPALAELRASLGMAAGSYDPHLSLLYCHLSDSVKEQLAAEVVPLFSTLKFDAVSVVRCPAENLVRADVESWQVLATRPLTRVWERT